MPRTLISLFAAAAFTAAAPASADLFFDDFESGLAKWQPRTGIAMEGQIVADPVASGRSNVLSFTALNQAGSIFSVASFAQSGVPYVLSFDYLGWPAPTAPAPNGLGGFAGVGIASGDPCDCWLAGTVKGYTGRFGEVAHLIDNGQWARYSIAFLPNEAELTAGFRLMLEDFSGSGGVPGDAFFDNISIEPIPEPSTYAMLLGGLAGLAFFARRRRRG
jgi:hypothetical protein